MKRSLYTPLLVLALALAAAWLMPADAPAQGAPSAVLTSCKGPVTVVRADGQKIAASFGLSLHDGDEVRTGDGGEAEVMFAAGNWVQVGANSAMKIKDRPGAASGQPLGGIQAGGTDASAASFDVVQNFLKLKNSEGTSSIGALRSGDKASSLVALAPCQTKVRAARPDFRWRIEDPGMELRLTVYDESGTIWHTDVSGVQTASYPPDAPALGPGVSYSWTLETTDPLVSPPLRTPAAFFEVIAPDEAMALESDLSRLESNKPGPVTYHLMRASLLFNRGLVDEAIGETETALSNDPDNASLHAILGRLYAEAGRTKDAIGEMNKAQE